MSVLLVGCDWTAFGFDAAHTRFNAKDETIPKVSAPELVPVWRGATGGAVTSSPAVVGGVAYVGSNDGYVYAFDAMAGVGCDLFTCVRLWRGATGGAVSSSPAVANGIVYVGSMDGRLYAFDAARCAATPTVACSPVWTGPTGAAVSSSPTVVNGLVYIGAADGRLYAFPAAGCGAASCGPMWRGVALGPVSSSPAVASGLVYVGSDNGRIYAFNATGCAGAPATACSSVWRGVTGGPIRGGPSVAGGVVYIGSDDGRLHAFDAAGCVGAPTTACNALWTGATGGPLKSSPAVASGVVYIGSDDGRLYAFNVAAQSGCSGTPRVCTPRWVGVTGGAVRSSPAVVNGVVYVGSNDQSLYAFGTNGPTGCTGTPAMCPPLWVGVIGGAVASSPAVANGAVYVGSAAGSLASVRAVVSQIPSTLESAVITPDRADTFQLAVAGNVTTASAPATNTNVNTRIGFWPKGQAPVADGQSCATWTGQGDRVNQQGAVLRVRKLASGARRGLMITKNVWLQANWIFNVHVWDTSAPSVYTPIASFDLSPVFNTGGVLTPLPWALCARVVGDVVTFIAWPAGNRRPLWTDPVYSRRVTLPAGWSAPGAAGWFIGHLRPGDAATFTDLQSGPVVPDESVPLP